MLKLEVQFHPGQDFLVPVDGVDGQSDGAQDLGVPHVGQEPEGQEVVPGGVVPFLDQLRSLKPVTNIDWKKHSYCVDRQYSIGYKLVNRVGGRKGAGKGSQNSPAVGSTMALPDYIVCVRGLVSVELCLFRRRNSYTF